MTFITFTTSRANLGSEIALLYKKFFWNKGMMVISFYEVAKACTGTVTTFLKIYEFIYLNFKVIISRTIFNNLFKIYIFRHSPKYLHLNPVVKEKSKYTNIKKNSWLVPKTLKKILNCNFCYSFRWWGILVRYRGTGTYCTHLSNKGNICIRINGEHEQHYANTIKTIQHFIKKSVGDPDLNSKQFVRSRSRTLDHQ